MNTFKKYCPNVWVAECEEKYNKGDVITLVTQYGKSVECTVYNFILEKNNKFYYSIVRNEEKTFIERKVDKYNNAVDNANKKSNDYYNKAQEGREFLVLAEPIKVGHHSENRHRALIDRNWNRMGKSVEFDNKAKEYKEKAEYWQRKSEEITLAMPKSLEYFTEKLEKAKQYHTDLKSGVAPKEHSYSMAYANKAVKELSEKVTIATRLWG